MSEEKDIHRKFAVDCFKGTWDLLLLIEFGKIGQRIWNEPLIIANLLLKYIQRLIFL